MAFVDLPADAQLDAASGQLVNMPPGAQLDGQMGGAMRLPAMVGSNLAKGALTGIGALGDIQGAAQNAVNPVADFVARLLGGRPPQFPERNMMPPPFMGSANLNQVGKELGIVDNPSLTPQNTGEKYLASGSQGMGGMLPYAAMGSGAVIPDLIKGAITGAAAGTGGEAGAQLVPSHPEIARAAGGVAAGLGSGAALGLGERLANAARGVGSPTLDAYKNIGVEPTLAGDVTGNPTLQMLQATAAKSPFAAGRVKAAGEQAIDKWGNAIENAAGTLGNSRTLQGAGEELQGATKNWLSQWKNASQQAWQKVDQQIPGTTPVPATNYAQALTSIRNSMPGAPNTANTLQPTLTRNLLDNLIADTTKGPLTWQDMRGIRSRIGEMISDPKLVADTGYADLKRLYGALSGDLAQAVAAKGPQAQVAFDNASTITRNGHGFVENVLSKVLKGDQISPEQAASRVLNTAPNGGTMLNSIRQEMPKAADELAAYKLRDMAAATAGQQNAAGTQLSPGTFLTDIAKLSPQARDALFSGIGRQLGDISTVAGSMKDTNRYLNTSNTGLYGALTHMFTGGAAGAATGGLKGAAYGALGLPAAEYLAGRAVTSPALTRLMATQGGQSSPLLFRGAGLYPELNYQPSPAR